MKRILALCSYIALLSGCSLVQPPEDVPSYIRVNSYSFRDTFLQGSASSKVTDIWVNVGNNDRGAYQIPVSVPVLVSGPQTVFLQAGVRENGISANILPYPFYTIFQMQANLTKGKLTTVNPTFHYVSNAKFLWGQGDFEGAANNTVLEQTAINTASCKPVNTKDSVFEGIYSYEVDLSQGHDTFDVQSNQTFFPTSLPVWVEMNYKTSVPMDMGIIILPAGTRQFIAGVNPSAKWNKIYFNLSPTLQYYYPNINFKIYFQGINGNKGNGHILLDNLKVLHLE